MLNVITEKLFIVTITLKLIFDMRYHYCEYLYLKKKLFIFNVFGGQDTYGSGVWNGDVL